MWRQLILIICANIFIETECQTSSQIDYIQGLIENATMRAQNFTLPNDASRYKPINDSAPPQDCGIYDFIIVGGGTTGSVLADRLSEISKFTVLVIEAGSFGEEYTKIPALAYQAAMSDYNWNYRSIPQTTACQAMAGQVCPFPRGLGFGGCTLINAGIYNRGHPTDYNRWAALGNPGWSFNDVLPYFIRSENYTRRIPDAPYAPGYHGFNGPWTVEYQLPENGQLQAFLDANYELGYRPQDPSGPIVLGYSQTQYTTKNGRREDTGTVFLRPYANRTNLKIASRSYATKINIDNTTGRALSVEFTNNGTKYVARAGKEIILSAGSIATPQLLMLSGIGPRAHLENVGIPVKRNLEVGTTLRDHSQFYGMTFTSNYSVPSASLREFIAEYLNNGSGPLSGAGPSIGIGFYHTSNEPIPSYPDLELILVTSNATSPFSNGLFNWNDDAWRIISGPPDALSSTFTFFVINLHARSVGTVRLRSNSPYDYPLIDPRFISDPDGIDINTLYKGIQLTLQLTNTTAFQKINATYPYLTLPACAGFQTGSQDYWYCLLRQMTFNIFHPVGTCPMGPNPAQGAVVDANLNVYGTSGLRVADASIFPFTFSGHTAPICVMVGEKASDIIKGAHIWDAIFG